MGNLRTGELLLVSIVLVLIFSSSKLGAIGDALGRLLRRKPPDGRGA